MRCHDVDKYIAKATGSGLSTSEKAELEAHRRDCETCDGMARHHFTVQVGDAMSHFLLTHKIGEGGSGTVFAGYDRARSRKVAIKVLHADRRGADHERVLRDLLALARLSHPNVVTVYEAGTARGQVFVAMEFVEGRPLDAWLYDNRPTPAEIRRVFVGIGRGLQAMHEAGLAHGNFKPSNVLVGAKGSAKVADLGLLPAASSSGAAGPARAQVRALTDAGASRYRAPEQAAGAATPAADQYAFCLALREAMSGQAPGSERPSASPAARPAPPWIGAIVDRGLRPDPSQRFPSMRALVDALDRDPAGRARRVVALAAAMLLAGGVTAGFLRSQADGPGDPCRAARPAVAAPWTKTVGSGGAGAESADPGLAVLRRQLEHRVDELAAARQHLCRGGAGRAETAASGRAARAACLDGHEHQLRAVIDALGAEPDPRATDRGLRALAELG
jgi:eukaryotic-like serine/threonine-protein kinase